MNIFQFLTIFWARRILIMGAAASCLIGALIVCVILPPRWESTARVLLNYVKPDTDTGQVISGNSMRFYIQTQQSLITDFTVAGRVVEQMGWLTDPELIKIYQNRPSNDQRDFKHFLADNVIQNTDVKLIDGTNIIEIKYTSNTSTGAQVIADTIRKAYITAALDLARQDAQQNVDWYTQQMLKAKQALDTAVSAEAQYSRENNLVMQGRGVDVESAHLESLSMQAAPSYLPNPPDQGASSSSFQLAGVNAQLASALKTLGPNNPEVIELKTKQAAIAALVEKDRINAAAEAQRTMSGGTRALAAAVAEQQAKVLAKSEQIGRLNQLNQDVQLRLAEYKDAAQKVSHFRQQAASADAGVTSLGNALTPKAPAFPNWFLIIPGALVLGVGIGVLVSLLLELLGRRVHTPEDLGFDSEAPLICIIAGPEDVGTGARRAAGRGLFSWWPGNRGPVRA